MITRKQFLRTIVGAGVGALGVSALAGCTDSGQPGADASPQQPSSPDAPAQIVPDARRPDAAPPACTSTSAVVSANHGHAITVSAADVAAGVDKTYDIQGSASHPHSVVVTAAMFTMLKANMAVMAASTTVGMHTHNVTISCVS